MQRILVAVILILACKVDENQAQTVPPDRRVNCDPFPGGNQQRCLSRGCIYDTSLDPNATTVPLCYFPPNTGYIVASGGNPILLQKSSSSVNNPYGTDFQELVFSYNQIGVHPFYLGLEPDGSAHGVFILNSNAQEVTTGPAPHLVYRTIGGQLEIFFFPGPTPEEVIRQYEQVIGTPYLPAYWAFGFQLCRWHYENLTMVQEAVARTVNAGIPFDVAFVDTDFFINQLDFTLDLEKWGGLPNYTKWLHSQNMHVTLNFDPPIQADTVVFQRALQQNASFIEWPRYDLVPQNVNGLHASASLKGGTVVRPVFFEFPRDNETHNLGHQFLWGSALMIAPVLYQGAVTVDVYLPSEAIWYSLYDYFYGTQISTGHQTFTAPWDYLIPVFVRGGYILPRQRPSTTTVASRLNEFQLLVALDANSQASGELYWDDGESLIPNDDYSQHNYHHFLYNFTVNNQSATLTITQDRTGTNLPLNTLDNIEILGYSYQPNLKSATLNGSPVLINTQLSSWSPFTKVLNITTSGSSVLNTLSDFTIASWMYYNGSKANGKLFYFDCGPYRWMFFTSNNANFHSNNGSAIYQATYNNGYDTTQFLLSPMAFPINQWFHVALTRLGTVTTMYLNGNAVNNITSTYLSPNQICQGTNYTPQLFIGYSQWNEYLNAIVDDFRIYQGALIASQVSSLASQSG
uniref:P-type domain-containing protein n=1 Tax=Acrobeloides nanus TaxID=290746 RepID=A0A914EBC2_9BILA